MHTAQDGESAGSLSYETGALVRIDLTTYTAHPAGSRLGPSDTHRSQTVDHRARAAGDGAGLDLVFGGGGHLGRVARAMFAVLIRSGACRWYARQDSNLRPSAPEADALSS